MIRIFISLAKFCFAKWNNFWFNKQPTPQLGIFRIIFGLFIILILFISYPNWDRFYGPDGSLPYLAIDKPHSGYSWSLFAITSKAWWPWVIYYLGLVTAITFTLGLKTRISTIFLFLIYASMLHRNPFLINGQDQVATMLLFFSCFAPLGSTFSLDEFLKRFNETRLAKSFSQWKPHSLWSLGLMQASIAILYIFSGPAKYFDDITWRNGSAIYYISLSDRWFRFPDINLFHNLSLSMILTFYTIFIEIAFPILVWFPKTRLAVLFGITLLHLSLMIFMASSVFYFNLMMVISFIIFLKPSDFEYITKFFPKRTAKVFYDGQCSFCYFIMKFIKACDPQDRIKLFDLRLPSTYRKFANLKREELEKEMYLQTDNGNFKIGFDAFRYIVSTLPALFIFLPAFYFPGSTLVGPKIYKIIADNRFRLFTCKCCGSYHDGACKLLDAKETP